MALADIVFSSLTSTKRKQSCFAGDVDQLSSIYFVCFIIVVDNETGDVTYLIFLLVYGVDGCINYYP